MKNIINPVSIHLIAQFLLLFLLFTANLFIGSVDLPFEEVWRVLSGRVTNDGSPAIHIVMQYRLPQTITAVIAGSSLAVAGLLMQTLFRNPLADPSILGISSGASLGVAVLLLVSGSLIGSNSVADGWVSQMGLIFAAFIGATAVLGLISWLGKILSNIVSLLIAGIMIAYVAGALVGIAKYFSQKEDLQAFVLWGLGSFSNVGLSQLPYFAFGSITGILMALLMIKPLNLLLLGEGYAANLGINVKRVQMFVLVIAGFLTAIVTAYAGPVAFIGLAVPHLARNIFRTSNHGLLIPAVILTGSSLALFCNLIARLPGFDTSLPVNAVTSLIGAPIVIWVIVRRKHLFTNE